MFKKTDNILLVIFDIPYKGEQWVNGVQICLMQKILNSELYNNEDSSCQDLFNFGFNSHPDCFTCANNGFCVDILQQFENLDCYAKQFCNDMKESQRARLAFQQIREASKLCDQTAINMFLSNVDDWLAMATGCTKDLLEEIKTDVGNCNNSLDLVFILDSSGSVELANFNNMKNFVANITSNYMIQANSTRVGVIQFSDTPIIEIMLGSIDNINILKTAINNITYIDLGTNVTAALKLVPTALINARANEGIPSVVILLTDETSKQTMETAIALHEQDIQIYAIGFGDNINETQLQNTASDPNYAFNSTDFSFIDKLRPIWQTVCTTPAKTEINQILLTKIGKYQATNLLYDFPLEGFTISIQIFNGELIVYGSFIIQGPTSLTADFTSNSTNMVEIFVSPKLFNKSATKECNVFVSIVGQRNYNIFLINTTAGDTRVIIGGGSSVHPLSIWTMSFITFFVMFSSEIMNIFPVSKSG